MPTPWIQTQKPRKLTPLETCLNADQPVMESHPVAYGRQQTQAPASAPRPQRLTGKHPARLGKDFTKFSKLLVLELVKKVVGDHHLSSCKQPAQSFPGISLHPANPRGKPSRAWRQVYPEHFSAQPMQN